MQKILLLGSGELGKEFVIAAKRLNQYVVAVDNYAQAPAMSVADESYVINMLDGNQLDDLVANVCPAIIVPEVEAIATDRFYHYENQGMKVIPSAKAANYTMNRKKIRDLAAQKLGLKTAKYFYASSESELKEVAAKLGYPCVIKPLMSSSGKGQTVIKDEHDIVRAWEHAASKGRASLGEVIVEEFIHFDSEITLLTVTQSSAETLFCPPIGHRQERGDYQESWQPAEIKDELLSRAKIMASKITHELGGCGIWGVEFFLTQDDVYFSELSPRPHDTGMVTLAGTQNLNEFELHLRAILGFPIPCIDFLRSAASAVILAPEQVNEGEKPMYEGLHQALQIEHGDVRIFGKPQMRPYRRMGVAFAYSHDRLLNTDVIAKAKQIASLVRVST